MKIAFQNIQTEDETHLIRYSIYENKNNNEYLIATKYGYPEWTEGIKFFQIVNSKIDYLGNINFLQVEKTEMFGSSLIAPYADLKIKKDEGLIIITYPSGSYVESYFDGDLMKYSKEFKNGIIFKYGKMQFGIIN